MKESNIDPIDGIDRFVHFITTIAFVRVACWGFKINRQNESMK